jgi:hypothetical protein
MADSGVVREENPGHFHGTKQGWEDHVHQVNLKKGIERLDRRSANPNKNAVKKHGHGGKYTVDGPYHDEDYAEPVPAAMDENDPNYVDPADEAADEAAGVSVVEVPKVEHTGVSAVHAPEQSLPQ